MVAVNDDRAVLVAKRAVEEPLARRGMFPVSRRIEIINSRAPCSPARDFSVIFQLKEAVLRFLGEGRGTVNSVPRGKTGFEWDPDLNAVSSSVLSGG